MTKTLYDPIQVGGQTFQNRVFMAPLTRSRANNSGFVPTELHCTYYKQRSNAGLIITEGTVVHPMGVGYKHVPGIYSDEQVAGWKKVTESVHDAGGHMFMQLWHVGRVSHPDFLNGKLPMAPSAINPHTTARTLYGEKGSVTPQKLTISQIEQIIQQFKNAAKNALLAGCDGIEIHSSNGYLFHQFFSNCSNQRSDEYGGSIENKTRFLFQVIESIISVIPENKIGVRLNPMLHGWAGISVDKDTIPTFDFIVRKLNDYDLAYLHMTRPLEVLPGSIFLEDTIAHYRNIYNGIFVANNGYHKEEAEKLILEEGADAVAFGRSWISNPDLIHRFKMGLPIQKADSKTFYTTGPSGYTDYETISE